MMNYTDYNFYNDTYKGSMSKNDFDRLVIRASAEVRKNIFDRDIKDCINEAQMATCSVADILLKIEQIEGRISKLISSDKTDKVISSHQVADLSISYANTTSIKDLESQITNQKSKIVEEIRLYLQDTGLLYRGV